MDNRALAATVAGAVIGGAAGYLFFTDRGRALRRQIEPALDDIVYRRVMDLINGLETRQIAPAMARVNAILEDVKGVTTKVKEETERVDHAIRTTMDRVDDTADRVRSNVRAKTSRVVGFIRGLRVAIESMLHAGPHHQPHESQT